MVRGWQRERTVPTRDPAGEPVEFVAGVTRDVHDIWVGVAAIGDEGSAVLTQAVLDQVVRNMRDALIGDLGARAVPTVDTTGLPISISTGHAKTKRGPVPVLRIGGGAAAFLADKSRARIETSMQAVVVDAQRLNRGDA